MNDTATAPDPVADASAPAEDASAPVDAAAGPSRPDADATLFRDLGLATPVVRAVQALGYEAATPIQAATIPLLLEGADVLGQAQTGTGKTAAFALPILSRLDLKRRAPQALVLVPTRELAIQVAEAFQKYAAGQAAFQVLPVYGGQSYTPQLAALQRGPQVIVGTPGRIIDHLERGTLKLEGIRHVVLDEADEMLAMGFADALEVILGQTPPEKQVALFSATMAPNIRRIAQRHLRQPREVVIKGRTATAANIAQTYWMVSGMHKLDALTRVVETAEFDAMLVFVRTRQATQDLSDRLQARGFASAALSGDVVQAQRERTIEQLKTGRLDIVVATDVAARGLDVERITHVVNYDVPYDIESYVHRIGRTGRAGRSGEAILFIAPRERRMLSLIEKATRQKISPLQLPTVDDVNRRRLARFKAKIGEAIAAGPGEFFRQAVQEVSQEVGVDLLTVASAAASLIEAGSPVLPSPATVDTSSRVGGSFERAERADRTETRPVRQKRAPAEFREGPRDGPDEALPPPADADFAFDDDGAQVVWRLAVGQQHGVQPGNIVGAIAHEAKLDGSQINGVHIRDDHSLVRLPGRLPKAVIDHLSRVRVRGQALALRVADDAAESFRGSEVAPAGEWPKRTSRSRPPFEAGTTPYDGPAKPARARKTVAGDRPFSPPTRFGAGKPAGPRKPGTVAKAGFTAKPGRGAKSGSPAERSRSPSPARKAAPSKAKAKPVRRGK